MFHGRFFGRRSDCKLSQIRMLSWATKLQASPWHGDHSLLRLVYSYTSCFRTCQKHPNSSNIHHSQRLFHTFRVLRSRKEPLMVYTRLTAQASLSFGKPWQTMRILIKAILTKIGAAIPVSLQERKQFLKQSLDLHKHQEPLLGSCEALVQPPGS